MEPALADEQAALLGRLERLGGQLRAGAPVAGSARSTANMRPLPRTSATVLSSLAASLRAPMMISPQAWALACRS